MTAGSSHGDGLLRWLVGGLVVGGIVLGLLVAAYAIGYHRGKEHRQSAAPQPTRPAQTTTAATSTAPAGGLATRGEQLFTADGCSGCHSLDGTAGAGPTVKGLAGTRVELTDGRTTTADDSYLTKAITDPDAEIVKGYQKGVMPAAVSSLDLREKPQDVAALVDFIKAQR
jgi:cytochrome c2